MTRTLVIPVRLRFDYSEEGEDWPRQIEIELPDGDIFPANDADDMATIKGHIWVNGGFRYLAKEIITEFREGKEYEIEEGKKYEIEEVLPQLPQQQEKPNG